MIYFGEPWNNHVQTMKRVPMPDKCCSWCQERFNGYDQRLGIPDALSESFTFYHPNCFMRTILGSVGHQQKKCNCFGGNEEDPPEMSLREAANAAVALFEYNKLH